MRSHLYRAVWNGGDVILVVVASLIASGCSVVTGGEPLTRVAISFPESIDVDGEVLSQHAIRIAYDDTLPRASLWLASDSRAVRGDSITVELVDDSDAPDLLTKISRSPLGFVVLADGGLSDVSEPGVSGRTRVLCSFFMTTKGVSPSGRLQALYDLSRRRLLIVTSKDPFFPAELGAVMRCPVVVSVPGGVDEVIVGASVVVAAE
jgi:hypothetical protein